MQIYSGFLTHTYQSISQILGSMIQMVGLVFYFFCVENKRVIGQDLAIVVMMSVIYITLLRNEKYHHIDLYAGCTALMVSVAVASGIILTVLTIQDDFYQAV
jgi:hypothetical protein